MHAGLFFYANSSITYLLYYLSEVLFFIFKGHLHHRGGGNNVDMMNNGGISWVDEPWNTTQSTMNQPTLNMQELLDQQRNFRRGASSTKSLHQSTTDDLWTNGGAQQNMWDSQRGQLSNTYLLWKIVFSITAYK